MGGLDLVAIVVFFLIGYWIVDYLWPKKKGAAAAGAGGRVTVRVSRPLDAPPERAFDAWLDPASAGRWLFATPQGRMARVEIDARVGGAYLFVDRRDGVDVEHTGEYLEIERPRRLVFNFRVPKFSAEATLVVVEFAPSGFGCRVSVAHDGVLPEFAQRTEQGWNEILEGLARELARAPGA